MHCTCERLCQMEFRASKVLINVNSQRFRCHVAVWILKRARFKFFFFYHRAASNIKRRATWCVSSASSNTRRPCVSSPCKFTKSELSRDYINRKTRNYEAACNIVSNHCFLVLCFRIFPNQLWHTDSFVCIIYVWSLTFYAMSRLLLSHCIFILHIWTILSFTLIYFGENNCNTRRERQKNFFKLQSLCNFYYYPVLSLYV